MSENATNEVIYYNSIYRHGIDEKRRVQIPSKWRPSQPDTEFTIIFWPKQKEGACLRVLPPEQMAKMKQDIDVLPNSDPQKTVLKRFIGSASIQVALDKAGRICIPEELAVKAEIKDQAVLVGLLDRFEIWSPERYSAVEAADAVIAQRAFEMME
jgi:MraZ protein